MQRLPPLQQVELTGVANHSGIQFELKVVQTPKQGRANPPAPLEGKESCNQPNKKQKKNGKNDVAGDRAAATNGVEQKGISANQGKKIVSLPKCETSLNWNLTSRPALTSRF